ncbi:MAG TPA: hypothetical protein VKH46_01380 [Thermoanaerobaculia bacterium]|jgi:hypothetical protein|nr:hypothetical protein [Thermoanaerobaculia bacterium]
MRRFAFGLLVALCLAATSAPSRAATLIGSIDNPPDDSSIVQGANSAFLVQGWVVGSQGVGRVDVLVDGQVLATTNAFSQRPDIQAIYPAIPNSLNSGWAVYLDSTALINGMHTISAVAVGLSDGGAAPETSILGTRSVQVDNASLNLHPFGDLQYPIDESTMRSICAVAQPSGPTTCQVSPCVNPGEPPPFTLTIKRSDLNPVSGWVLDTGARGDLGQTGYVQLLIDGVVIADTRQDCVLINGGYANCYGLNRPDVEKQYPGFVNSDNAGFVFDFAAVDDGTGHLVIFVPALSTINEANVGVRSVTTIVPGKHDISIRAGDVAETVSAIGTPISVNFTTGCTGVTSIDHPAFGNVETPVNQQILTGTAEISGWAFDPDGFSCDSTNSFSHIDVDVDGHYTDIITKQPCGIPCPPDTNCLVVDPDCQPSAPGSNDNNAGTDWCLIRADVPVHDVRVPSGFVSPNPPCNDSAASWTAGLAKVGWSFALDTTQLANTAHDLNVYASDCRGYRTLIGRRRFEVFNDPSRQTVTAAAHSAPATVQRHP